MLKTQKNRVKNSKTNQNPNIPIRRPQLIPFKITRRKLQQLFQPQELVPSRAFFCGPQTSHKMIPRFLKRIKVFSHKGSLVLSFSLRRNSTRVYLFQLPAGWWEHPLHFSTSQQSTPSSILAVSTGLGACGRRFCLSGKHTQASLERQILPGSVMACCNTRHICRLFLIFSIDSPLLLMFFFFPSQC